jgi:hypothetical protein
MTTFQPNPLRHCCRNPRCKSKLPEPVENIREAFCARGCHTSFYRKRCLACEMPMERKTETQRLCGRPRCRSEFRALQAHNMLGRYIAPAARFSAQEVPGFIGSKGPAKTDRPWRIVAGSLTDAELHLATVGAEHANKTNRGNREHYRSAGAKAEIQRQHAPVNIVGGYRFPDAPLIDLGRAMVAADISRPLVALPVGDGLAIPAFLRREVVAIPDGADQVIAA